MTVLTQRLEAVQRPGMRFVAAKTMEQQDVQCLHRIRSQVVAQRTAQVNQIRGLLLEYGITIPQGRAHVRKAPAHFGRRGKRSDDALSGTLIGAL